MILLIMGCSHAAGAQNDLGKMKWIRIDGGEGGKDRGDIARQTDRHQLLLRGVELEDLLRKRVQRHHQKRAGIFFIEIHIGVDPWKLSRPVIVDDMSEGAFQIGSISVGIGSCA